MGDLERNTSQEFKQVVRGHLRDLCRTSPPVEEEFDAKSDPGKKTIPDKGTFKDSWVYF